MIALSIDAKAEANDPMQLSKEIETEFKMNEQSFSDRHIGPSESDVKKMLDSIGFDNLSKMMDSVIPKEIFSYSELQLGPAESEASALVELKKLVNKNHVFRSYIGMGYSPSITPAVIQRNVFENPGWYTQYTPYQAEISQGRLEALLNFQTMIIELTAMEVANASLLDEATAASEAMNLCFSLKERKSKYRFFISEKVHPQTIAVVKTRAEPLGIDIHVGDHLNYHFDSSTIGVLVQYPDTDGNISDFREFVKKANETESLVVVAADLMSLVLLQPPGSWGADIVVGNTQRFGVPLGYGGPHAAYFATKEKFKRVIPGRIVGVSKDSHGRNAFRLALQTREQHIRRDRATSNICTSQVLLAIMASMYAVYHGPAGLKKIANRIHEFTSLLHAGLRKLGFKFENPSFFDTLKVVVPSEVGKKIIEESTKRKINFRIPSNKNWVGISLDETTRIHDLIEMIEIFSTLSVKPLPINSDLISNLFQDVEKYRRESPAIPKLLQRVEPALKHSVFCKYNSETEMLRYIRRLESKDLSLTTSMIPLGSCTMKLNATAELLPVSWPEINSLHPFAPIEQTQGMILMIKELEHMLSELTGFPHISLQPNAGSQGEYTGLLVIRKYHHTRGEPQRNICLIPRSAHGTNPATATMVGMNVIPVECDVFGNIDLSDLKLKAQTHAKNLAALMVTYPSTHGVFEEEIKSICKVIHDSGGQIYLDGANLNAQIGYCRPADYGADVCHVNLHKTFCIPHGGGGPGMGPIGVQLHLKDFLPSHPSIPMGGSASIGTVAAAPWGSPSILPISWMYIRMMGAEGLRNATAVAILNANYIVKRLENHFPVLYRGKRGQVAHECIFDMRPFKAIGVEVEDIAKRLMDYGFHAPTVSFPVSGTMMVEPTESESKKELDRFCDAMILIYHEIKSIEDGAADRKNNPLKNAPHTSFDLAQENWTHAYSREQAAFPAPWLKEHKYWPVVNRIDNVAGDRNLICSCPPMGD